jgi:hypothetical protein
VLQVERNVLESADYWEYIPELSAHIPKKRRRYEEEKQDDNEQKSDVSSPRVQPGACVSAAITLIRAFLPPDIAHQFILSAQANMDGTVFARLICDAFKHTSTGCEARQTTIDEEFDIVTDGCPLVMRMSKLLLQLLGPERLSMACPSEHCAQRVSVFAFAVVGDNIASLRICCTECADELADDVTLCRIREIDRVRAITWLCAAGEAGTTLCAVCCDKDQPIGVLQDGWQLAYRCSRAKGGKREAQNLAVAHSLCNLEQGTRHLDDVRAAAGLGCYKEVMDINAARKSLRRFMRS